MDFDFGRGARVACALCVLSVSTSAWGESVELPSTEPDPGPVRPSVTAPPATVPDAEEASWQAAYAEARLAMTQGRFAVAKSSFAALAQSAHSGEKRALCSELAALAEQWAGAGLTLLTQRTSDAAEPRGNARSNERTTDEISVLYLNSVVYGLGTGVWLATLTEPQEAASAILPALGLAGAAAGAVALADHSLHLAYGVPASAVTGLYIGLEEGITWSLWNQSRAAYFDEWQGKTVATVIWGSATVGALTGAAVGSMAGTTPGRASYVGSTALWGGLLSGLFTASLTGNARGQRDDAGLLGAALGTNIGVIGGVLSAGTLSPSVARVRFIDLGGMAGGLLAGGLYVSAANNLREDDVQGLLGVTALGIAGGLALSTVLTRGMPADHLTEPEPTNGVSMEPTLIPVRGGTLIGAMGAF